MQLGKYGLHGLRDGHKVTTNRRALANLRAGSCTWGHRSRIIDEWLAGGLAGWKKATKQARKEGKKRNAWLPASRDERPERRVPAKGQSYTPSPTPRAVGSVRMALVHPDEEQGLDD